MDSKILVIGSSNSDMVIQAAKLPAPGETVMGKKFFMNPGGKGANQAVAASRMGGPVAFISKIGNDIFGKQAVYAFKKEGIITEYVITDPSSPSGVALITVDDKGENSIVVAPGANSKLSKEDIEQAKAALEEAEIILMQLEVPMETVEYAAALAAILHKKLILNPAPAQALSLELLKNVYILTPNETEASIISGIKVVDEPSAAMAAAKIKQMGVKNIIITLGAKGAYVLSDHFSGIVPAEEVQAIDTTAAGDVFNGALTVGILEGLSIEEAVAFANSAATISVTRIGAQSSIPYRKEIMIKK